MDYRKIKQGMRVRLKDKYQDKVGTIRYCYYQDGHKYFDIIWDGEDRMSCAWGTQDRERLIFDLEEYKQEFDDLLKSKKV